MFKKCLIIGMIARVIFFLDRVIAMAQEKGKGEMSTLEFLSGLTVGSGFKLNIFDIDYAFVPYGDLGYTHRSSLLAKF